MKQVNMAPNRLAGVSEGPLQHIRPHLSQRKDNGERPVDVTTMVPFRSVTYSARVVSVIVRLL